MTRPVNPADARLDAVVDLLQGYTDGLATADLAVKLDTGQWAMRNLVHHLRQAGRIVLVPVRDGRSVWATPRNAAPLARRLRAASADNAMRRQRERRAARRQEPESPTKLYDNPRFNPDDVPDLPVVRRINTCWAPIRQAPGPTSIFDLANHA